MPDELALAEHDAMAISAGITTTFVSLTDGIELGIRNRTTIRRLMPLLRHPALSARTRLHLRHETCACDGLEELLTWLEDGSIHLMSIADHVPDADDAVKLERFAASINRRDGGDPAAIVRLARSAAEQREAGRRNDATLAIAARRSGIPLASHDDADEAAVYESLARGISICEFPMTLPAARTAWSGGAAVLAGAPNLVRGASHLGLLSAAEGIGAGAVDCLCSDYHPASLFHAPFLAAERGLLPLAQAWRMVSSNPAAAVGLTHRTGSLSEGHDADLLLVEPPVAGRARLRAVYVAGRAVARY
jgi:alpha-D-ribose 1-methylphosphonate 5-triphosphate diphosphatase